MQVLGKHKYYCEMCKKQCRDENSFKQHKLSSFHQQKMFEFHQNPEIFIEKFSQEFDFQFNETFKIKFGSSAPIPATKAYNEYIKDPHHTHLNSTRWANLAEYVMYLQETGRYEVTKEKLGDSEQFLIRLIDNDDKQQKGLSEKEKREELREQEKRREQKEFEKMIKKANKLQEKQETQNKDKTVEVGIENVQQINNNDFKLELSLNKAQVNSNTGLVGVKRFMSSDQPDAKEELLNLQKQNQKTSVLDKIIKQSGQLITKHDKQSETIGQNGKQDHKNTEWVKNDLIVKIKDEQSKYFKLKAEVRDVNYKDKILVRVLNESRDKVYFKESDLSKVLPSEGGRVLILNSNKIGKVLEIDMKRSEVYVRDDESGNKSWHKFNEVCKINL